MVDFAGWSMPVQYKSIVAEHMAVRSKAGLFDVSHMGEFTVAGQQAYDFVQYMIANDLRRLSASNTALYTQFVRPGGGTVDDLIVYRREDDFFLVVNASNIDKDWAWLKEHEGRFPGVVLTDVSEATALIALQGPQAAGILARLAGPAVTSMPSFSYGTATVDGIAISFGRTGYTGEDGFEIFVPPDCAERLWLRILDAGADAGIEPCGLGARDTLRLEAGLPLYGHELDEETSPIESGLAWSVKLDKGDFAGREALLRQKVEGVRKQCVCLKVDGRALPRQGYGVFAGDVRIGQVSSGSQGIFVGYPIAMAFVEPEFAKLGTAVAVEIRGTKVPAQVVRRPFYKRK